MKQLFMSYWAYFNHFWWVFWEFFCFLWCNQVWESNAPLWRQLVEPAADDGRGSLGQGGVAGVGGDDQVLVGLWGEAVGGQGQVADGGWRFSHRAVTLRVSGVKSLRQTLRPRELVTSGAQTTLFISTHTLILQSILLWNLWRDLLLLESVGKKTIIWFSSLSLFIFDD